MMGYGRSKLTALLLLLILILVATAIVTMGVNGNDGNNNDDDDFGDDDDDFMTMEDETAPKVVSESVASTYEAPRPKRYFWFESFSNSNVDPFARGWIKSEAEEYAAQDVQWTSLDNTDHEPVIGIAGDRGLLLTKPAQRYAFGHPLSFDHRDKNLVVQYEVKFEKTLECGGAYIKLLRGDVDLKQLKSDTPYVIMFGPDRCGATDKVHFILQHQNPKTGMWEEKHLTNAPQIKNDQLSHLYTLVIRTDNTFEILIDQESVRKGSLLEDFQPSINPPKEIDDPEDKKPEDWVDDEMIDDPEDTKPEDWVEDKTIPDPNAKKPEDWDDEEDGEWVPPHVPNPDYVGEWRPRRIKNPAYKGVWKPRRIPNPNYFEDDHPHRIPAITALSVEIWTMQKNLFFDNFLITDDLDAAMEFANATWKVKYDLQKEQVPRPPEPTMVDTLSEVFEQLKFVANQYPLVAIGIIVSIISTIPLTIFCVRMVTRTSNAEDMDELSRKKKDQDSDDDDSDEARDSDDSDETKTGVRRRGKKNRTAKE